MNIDVPEFDFLNKLKDDLDKYETNYLLYEDFRYFLFFKKENFLI